MGVEFFRQKDCPVKRSSDSDEAMSRKAYRVYGHHCRNSFQMPSVITSVP